MRARPITLLLFFLGGVHLAAGQTVSGPASALRSKIQKIPLQSKVSVFPASGQEEFGTLLSAESEAFTFYDVDDKTTHTLRYEEVKRVRRGYGGYNAITHRHTDQRRSRTVTIVVLGGLLAFAIAAGVILHGS